MVRNCRPLVLVSIIILATAVPVTGASTDAKFGADVVETTVGETAEISITLSNTDAAVVTLGSERVNYIATLVVQDGNDDRTVTLQYNTANAGHGNAFSVINDADSVSVESETEFDDSRLLDAGSYGLSVVPGTDTSTSNETDVGTLVVREQTETTTGTQTPTSPYAGHVTELDDGVTVAPAQNQTITGTLDLDGGTEIVVIARQSGAFLKTEDTTVGANGQFTASFDFSELPEETDEFELEIRADGESVTAVPAEFATPPATTKQALQNESQETQEATSTSQGGPVSGFGMAVSLVALIAAAFLAVRRSN